MLRDRNKTPREPGRVRIVLRNIRGSAFLAALVASFVTVFAALAMGQSSDEQSTVAVEQPGQYPATERVEIDRGSFEGVGDYRLLYSRDHTGGICIGLEVPSPVPGHKDIPEGCGGPENMNVGTVTDGDGLWTVVHGKVPNKTKKLKIKKYDGSTVDAGVIDDARGIDGKWVVHKVKGKLGDAEFEAVDDAGKKLAGHKLGG